MFLPHFDVFCDLLLNRRTATWNLFVLYNKETNYFKIFQHNSKAGPLPTLTNTKIAIWRNLLSIQNEANSLVAMRSKELWLVQGNHATVKLESSVACHGIENLQRKQNWTSKSRNLIQNAGKVKSVFVIRAALWAEKTWTLPWILQELKKPFGKLAVAVNIDTLEAIRFELWMKGALVTVEICVLCGWWFSSAFDIVSETLSSCDTDGREL
jgi:hypothetical protein